MKIYPLIMYVSIYMCVCVICVYETTRNGCQSAWEEWLVLFARYLFNFFHDSRLHVLAELRGTLPSLPKQTKGVSERACACEWVSACVRACVHTLSLGCASVFASVCDSEYPVCFRQMWEALIWIFTCNSFPQSWPLSTRIIDTLAPYISALSHQLNASCEWGFMSLRGGIVI